MNIFKLRYGYDTIEEYVEAEYDKLFYIAMEDESVDMVLDSEFSFDIKHAIVSYKNPDNLPYGFFTVPDREKARIEEEIAAAIATLDKYAPELLDVDPFTDRKPYNPATQKQVEIAYRDKFINKLMNLGLPANKSKEIEKTLINL